MNHTHDSGLSSTTPQSQRPMHHNHHQQQQQLLQQHSSNKLYNASSPSHPEDSPTATTGRQRVRTEPSPRHQQNSSGWLGPYNEQPSPLQSSKSPRGVRLAPPGAHHSPATPERNGGGLGGGGVLGSDRIVDTHNRTLGGWQLDGAVSRSNSHNYSGSGLFAAAGGGGSSDGPTGFKRREFEPRNSNNSSNTADQGFPPASQMEPSNSIQSLVESIDDDHVFKLTEMTKKRVEHNNPAQKRPRVVSLPTNDPSTGKI